jgi:hypothetical protein
LWKRGITPFKKEVKQETSSHGSEAKNMVKEAGLELLPNRVKRSEVVAFAQLFLVWMQ